MCSKLGCDLSWRIWNGRLSLPLTIQRIVVACQPWRISSFCGWEGQGREIGIKASLVGRPLVRSIYLYRCSWRDCCSGLSFAMGAGQGVSTTLLALALVPALLECPRSTNAEGKARLAIMSVRKASHSRLVQSSRRPSCANDEPRPAAHNRPPSAELLLAVEFAIA